MRSSVAAGSECVEARGLGGKLVSRNADGWTVVRRLNGDQSNQGRQLSMDPNRMEIFRV